MGERQQAVRPQPGWTIPALACLLLAWPPFIQAKPVPKPPVEEPPLIGQPEHFSGGVGRFKVVARASATELQAEEPLLYCLHVVCTGPVGQPPIRPDLRRLPRFKSRFVISERTSQDSSEAVGGGHVWDFHYALKPRSPEVTEIPAVLFGYYKPGVVPAHKGYWTTATQSIQLKVRPRNRATLVNADGQPLRAPERFYQFVEGSAVLGREGEWAQPGPFLLAALLLGPPTLCVGWFLAWRRLYPNAARLARIRRSQAAVRALQALQAGKNADAVEQARTAFRAVEAYLRDRLGLVMATPTPTEIEAYLADSGLSSEIAGKVAAFLRACDETAFAPQPGVNDLLGAGECLILVLESEPCI